MAVNCRLSPSPKTQNIFQAGRATDLKYRWDAFFIPTGLGNKIQRFEYDMGGSIAVGRQ